MFVRKLIAAMTALTLTAPASAQALDELCDDPATDVVEQCPPALLGADNSLLIGGAVGGAAFLGIALGGGGTTTTTTTTTTATTGTN